MFKHLTKADFNAEISGAQPVLVDFWAPWCGPCRMIGPIIDELADDSARRAKICKVNVDDEPDLAREYNVVSIPCVIIFRDGKAERRLIGAHSKEDYADALAV